jgi:hypothetical protein
MPLLNTASVYLGSNEITVAWLDGVNVLANYTPPTPNAFVYPYNVIGPLEGLSLFATPIEDDDISIPENLEWNTDSVMAAMDWSGVSIAIKP